MSDGKFTRRQILASGVAMGGAAEVLAQSDAPIRLVVTFPPGGTLTDAFRATLQSPEVHGKLTAGGFEVMATDGPGADRHARQEYERWSAFVRNTKLKLDE